MKYASFYRCDLCNGKFDSGKEVKNDVCLMNGSNSRVFGDVCDTCLAKMVRIVDQEFPKNKRLRDQEEVVVAGQIA